MMGFIATRLRYVGELVWAFVYVCVVLFLFLYKYAGCVLFNVRFYNYLIQSVRSMRFSSSLD